MFLLLESIAAGLYLLASRFMVYVSFFYFLFCCVHRDTTLIPIPPAALCTIIRTCSLFLFSIVLFSKEGLGHRFFLGD
jgi:hypothetical protein